MKFLIFALIPLILTIGITPAINNGFLPEADALKAQGKPAWRSGAGVVCGDRLCSEIPSESEKSEPEPMPTKACTKDYRRVCGVDEKTYGNMCTMESSGMTLAYEGECKVDEIKLPPYPDVPTIHPKLKASNDFWYPPTVHKVTDGVYSAVGFDASNSIMIKGDDGIIIVDTLSTYENGKAVMGEFRKITAKPVKAIIYTHGHLDHVHGTGAFLEEGEDVEIYAHESHLDFYINENSVLGPGATLRTIHAAGAMLPLGGPNQKNLGVFAPMVPGTIAYVAPTQTFSDELEVEISGIKMKMVFVAGESADQIYVWLPEKKVLLIADNIYAIIPNIYTLRGAVYRDPMDYVNALDQMIPLEAEYVAANHVIPIIGKENVRDVLVSTRDATQYIYDQTIRGMNAGYTADELSRMVQLPEHLDNHPWLTKARNDVSAHVKQIYFGNFGWFEGNSAFLNAVSLEERSQKIVNGFGGVDASIDALRTAIDNKEYEWAADLELTL